MVTSKGFDCILKWHSNLHIILHESGAVKPEMHFSAVTQLLTGAARRGILWKKDRFSEKPERSGTHGTRAPLHRNGTRNGGRRPPKRRPKAPGTLAEAAAPKKPREPFFRRQRRELPTPGAIYCNSRARRIRTWQIVVFALLIVEVTVMAVALNPVYWIGTALLVFWCVGQLFDRRPARHSVAAVVLYFLIAVMIGIFAVQELLGA